MINRGMTFNLVEALETFNGKKVLVVGDIGLDRYNHGLSTRLCPEAPVPVFTPDREECRPGLAGNVAANVVALGGEVRLCSLIGDDQRGVDLCDALETAKVEGLEKYVGKIAGRKTTVKNRYYANRHMLLRIDEEDTSDFEAAILRTFTIGVCQEIQSWAQVVVIQDYGKGLITRDLVRSIVQCSADYGVPILVDPSPKQHPTIYSGCHYLKPNQSELEAMMAKIHYQVHSTYAYDQFADLLSCRGLVVTQGDKGMLVETRDEKRHIPALKKEVFDVCGAGDTVTATLALGIASGLDLFDSAQIANAAASVVVGKFGTATVNLKELSQILQEAEHGSGNKTYS